MCRIGCSDRNERAARRFWLIIHHSTDQDRRSEEKTYTLQTVFSAHFSQINLHCRLYEIGTYATKRRWGLAVGVEIILLILLLLSVITVVGHGIWVLLAKLLAGT